MTGSLRGTFPIATKAADGTLRKADDVESTAYSRTLADNVLVGKEIVMELRNPFPGGGRHASGNRMAIVNIRERLQLHFDAEASMRSEVKDGSYRVMIRMPYITAPP